MPTGIPLPPEQREAARVERHKNRLLAERIVRAEARQDRDEQAKTAYLKGLTSDGTVSAGIRRAKVGMATLLRWRETDLAFSAREHAAREVMIDSLESEAYRRGVTGVQRPVYQAGALVGYTVEKSDLLLQLLLRANRPERYREKSEVTVTQVVKSLTGVDPSAVL